MKEIITVEKPQECFEEIEKLINVVFNGFMALAMDYGYHIHSTFDTVDDGKNKIFELRDTIHYRLNSSKLHFYLLLRRKMDIEERFAHMLKKDPKGIRWFSDG